MCIEWGKKKTLGAVVDGSVGRSNSRLEGKRRLRCEQPRLAKRVTRPRNPLSSGKPRRPWTPNLAPPTPPLEGFGHRLRALWLHPRTARVRARPRLFSVHSPQSTPISGHANSPPYPLIRSSTASPLPLHSGRPALSWWTVA